MKCSSRNHKKDPGYGERSLFPEQSQQRRTEGNKSNKKTVLLFREYIQ